MKLAEIAGGINAHLKRFEADPKINPPAENDGFRPYYYASAGVAGRWIDITYILFQGWSHLSKADAWRYLAWLDAGNVGRHWEALESQ